jgi:hypothetical protein
MRQLTRNPFLADPSTGVNSTSFKHRMLSFGCELCYVTQQRNDNVA